MGSAALELHFRVIREEVNFRGLLIGTEQLRATRRTSRVSSSG